MSHPRHLDPYKGLQQNLLAVLAEEGGGWSVTIPGLSVHGDGETLDSALDDAIVALREYAMAWNDRLCRAPTTRSIEPWSNSWISPVTSNFETGSSLAATEGRQRIPRERLGTGATRPPDTPPGVSRILQEGDLWAPTG